MRHPHDIVGHLLSRHSVADWASPHFNQSCPGVKEIQMEEIQRGAKQRQFKTPLESYHTFKLAGEGFAEDIRGKYATGGGEPLVLTPEQKAMIGKRVLVRSLHMPRGTIVNYHRQYSWEGYPLDSYDVRLDESSGGVWTLLTSEFVVIV